MPADRPGKNGFSLLEALVATAVVALLLVPTLQSLVLSTTSSRAASRQLALKLVVARLLASMPPSRGESIRPSSGTDGAFTWSISVAPTMALLPAGQQGPALLPFRVTISATGGGSHTTFETVRLGPP